jgi:Transcription elongation factor, GreA/GreB, C-term
MKTMPSTVSVKISLYSRVLIDLVDISDQAERLEFTLVPPEQADLKSALLGENTPLGRLLLGHFAGQSLPYRAGDLKEVRILAVRPAGEAVPSDAAAKRRRAVRKAAAQSEITSQMIFSTASGSKWGDYDVDVDKLLNDEE